jgi:hypothetical protein
MAIFFIVKSLVGEFCWLSRNQLYTEPFTDQDRAIVEAYCERKHLPSLLKQEIILEELERALSPSPPPAHQRRHRRWCSSICNCFKQ